VDGRIKLSFTVVWKKKKMFLNGKFGMIVHGSCVDLTFLYCPVFLLAGIELIYVIAQVKL